MSESPGPGGDAQTSVEVKASRSRPAEGDDGIEVIPTKLVKVSDKAEDNLEGNDDAAALEEEDLDEEDDDDVPEEEIDFGEEDEMEDGEEFVAQNEENIFDETGESSTDLDEFIQANLAYIDDCQSDIDTLNQKANDEILKVEQKYNKLRQPVYTRRNKYIERIPNFWSTVFSRHPQLKRVLTKEDIKCLKFLVHLQIDDFEDSRSGYSIKFKFAKNQWFSNTIITKEYHLPWHDSPSCDCTAINWNPGMNLTQKPSSFFSWFCSQEDASTDDIAEIIKEELWPNPLQSYMMKENGEAESEDERFVRFRSIFVSSMLLSSSEEEEEGPVYIDDEEDEEAEYISSEGSDAEEWKRPAALGKEAPSTSKEEQYVIDDDENEDGVDYDDALEDDDGADISSQGNYGFEDETDTSRNLPLDGEDGKLDDDLATNEARVNNVSDTGQVVTSHGATSKEYAMTLQSADLQQAHTTANDLNDSNAVTTTGDTET